MPVKKHKLLWRKISAFFDSIKIGVGEGVLIGIALVFIFFALQSFLLSETRKPLFTFSPAEPTSSISIASTSALVPSVSLPDIGFNGSFTELFSGVGWENISETTAYLDSIATAISLTPEFTVAPIGNAQGLGGQIPKIPATVTGAVTKTNNGYVIRALGKEIISPYPGVLRFGYDPSTDNTLVVYSAYASRVFQVDARGEVADYSERFGSRAFGGARNGELAVYPTIFSKDGAWWLVSGEGSTKPFLSKISGSSVIDYASLAFKDENILRAEPSTEPHTIVVKGNKKTYLLQDKGFVQKKVQWVSARLNDWNGAISTALISRVEDSVGYEKDLEGSVNYFLSNNGGATWVSTKPGAFINFPLSLTTSGVDIRFKVELSPAKNNIYVTPWVGTVALLYTIVKSE